MEHHKVIQTTQAEPQRKSHAVTEEVQPTQNKAQPVLCLHRMIGNQGVQRLIQAKLKVGAQNDEHEQEADQVAEQIVDSSLPHKKCAACEAGEMCAECKQKQEGLIQRKADSMPFVGNASISEAALQNLGAGNPLAHSTRDFFESRFGYNFGHVRIHADAWAARTAQSVNAQAFT